MSQTESENSKCFKNPVIKHLIDLYQPIAALNYFNYLAGWDTETYMPMHGMHARGSASAQLAVEIQNKYLDPEFQKALANANKEKDLNDYERNTLRVLNHISDSYNKLPASFIKEYTELTAKTSTIWAEARRHENVAEFLPWLEKIFALTRKRAEYLGIKTEAYDVIFADYELGLDAKLLHKYMADMKAFLLTIDLNSKKLTKSDYFSNKPYNISKMAEVNLKVLKLLGYDPTRMRLDVSTHPFSLFLAPDDIRLTTKYPEFDFTGTLLPCIHEFGHGLFSSNVNRELAHSPLWPETSYALHESQSRFWENMIARSKGFVLAFLEDFKDAHIGISENGFNAKTVLEYLNHVKPSLVRVEADEISYHWHIIIRYEIERDILNGKLAVKDVESAWNSKYQEYLGITPSKPSLGVLQDIHWSFGSIGYFPTYSMGSTTSAMFREKLIADTGFDFNAKLTHDQIKVLNDWFKENVQQYAGTYSLEEIWDKVAGEKFSANPWIKYIKNKYQIA